jgi:hypothetical protein
MGTHVYISGPSQTITKAFFRLLTILDQKKIQYRKVDTVPGWYNANQDWIEVFVEKPRQEWDGVYDVFRDKAAEGFLQTNLFIGNLVMIIIDVGEI